MDEDEMVQVAAQRTLIEHGIIVLEVVLRGLLRLAAPELQVLERDEEIVRIRDFPRGIEDLSPATENLTYEVGIRMTEDAPSFFLVVCFSYVATFH